MKWLNCRQAYSEHISKLCIQLLEKNNISLVWADILTHLGSKISHYVRADVLSNRDHMDIRSYIHIKKVGFNQYVH